MINKNMKNPKALLSIIIVNYRVSNLTIDCLNSLASEIQDLPGTNVIIVDNDSGDGSVKQLQAAINNNGWGSWASVLSSSYNGGYAFGNNLGIRSTSKSTTPPSYFFILNPDTQVRPNALKTLINFMEQHPSAGIIGPSLENSEGQLLSIAFRFPSILSELESGLRLGIVSKLLSNSVVTRKMTDNECEVDWIPGGAMLLRREVFESVGLMDEGYFLFYEETDLCLQAKRTGWSCWYVPQARVMDICGQSRKKTKIGNSNRKPQYWFDSRRRYFIKNHGIFYAALADLAWISGFIVFRIRQFIMRKSSNTDPHRFLGDFIRNSVFAKGGLPKSQLANKEILK